MRYFLELSYHGANYHGWQRQQNAHSVQQEIEEGLTRILGQETVITGSGRTDAGVHAHFQVAHFDTSSQLPPDQLAYKLNAVLPDDIAIAACRPVREDAHARFDAEVRGYHYFIHQKKNPFLRGQSYFYSRPLDVDLMNEAAHKLLGRQDFESFSRVKTEVNHFECEVFKALWYFQNDQLVFNVRANRFLRGMVRALVGTLLEVGRKKLTVEDFVSIIAAKNRTKAGKAAPPHGLYLSEVNYPNHIYL
ncbi:tRNA pseudouridine(38-40) synthase TruA [Roseivirga thermotolerans]|uniref:tRNA pseudouridine(38-40) synthase TruA n=1 Tax=Roseivirga thermotolerans TaxID=1758176 RepID=UPI00273D4CC4|nr:tRNA pseudouridine(38-40) synthase TruA [Roseivirga thermotolerans]